MDTRTGQLYDLKNMSEEEIKKLKGDPYIQEVPEELEAEALELLNQNPSRVDVRDHSNLAGWAKKKRKLVKNRCHATANQKKRKVRRQMAGKSRRANRR